jgi:hypothetical protein
MNVSLRAVDDPYWMARGLAEKAGVDYAELRRDHRVARWHVKAEQRGRVIGWDVTCRCGWESRTGGAIRASVKRDHIQHVADVVLDILVPG